MLSNIREYDIALAYDKRVSELEESFSEYKGTRDSKGGINTCKRWGGDREIKCIDKGIRDNNTIDEGWVIAIETIIWGKDK